MTFFPTFYITIILISVVNSGTLPVKPELLNLTVISSKPVLRKTISFDLKVNENNDTSLKLAREAHQENHSNSQEKSSNETTTENYVNSSNLSNVNCTTCVGNLTIKQNNMTISSQEAWVKEKDGLNDIQANESGNLTDQDQQSLTLIRSYNLTLNKMDSVPKIIRNYTESNTNVTRNNLKRLPKTNVLKNKGQKYVKNIINIASNNNNIYSSTKIYTMDDFGKFVEIRNVLNKIHNTREQNSKKSKKTGNLKRGSSKRKNYEMRNGKTMLRHNILKEQYNYQYVPMKRKSNTRRNDMPQFPFPFPFSGVLDGYHLNIAI